MAGPGTSMRLKVTSRQSTPKKIRTVSSSARAWCVSPSSFLFVFVVCLFWCFGVLVFWCFVFCWCLFVFFFGVLVFPRRASFFRGDLSVLFKARVAVRTGTASGKRGYCANPGPFRPLCSSHLLATPFDATKFEIEGLSKYDLGLEKQTHPKVVDLPTGRFFGLRTATTYSSRHYLVV